jgi:hypothetical protein
MPDEKVLEIIVRARDLATKTLENISDAVEKQESKWQRLSRTIGKVGAGITAGATAMAGVLMSSIPAWEATRKAQLAVMDTFRKMPQLMKVNMDEWLKWVNVMEMKLAIDDGEINMMAAKLGMYGLTEKQIKELIPLIVDLSRKYGIDLATATRYIGDAIQGNTSMLKRYGISLDLSAAKTKEGIDTNKAYELTLKQLQQAVGGYSQTLDKEGMLAMERFKLAMGNLRETMGMVVWKALTPFVEKMNDLIIKFNNASGPIVITATRIAMIGTAIGAIVGPMMIAISQLGKFAKVLKWVGGVALSLFKHPLVLAIMAVITALVALYKTNKQFKDWVNSVWGQAKDMAKWLWDNWPAVWQEVKDAVGRALRQLKTMAEPLLQWLAGMLAYVGQWWQKAEPLLEQVIITLATTIETIFRGIADFVADNWQTIWDITQHTWEIIRITIETAVKTILDIITLVLQMLTGDWAGAWETIKEITARLMQAIVGIINNLGPLVVEAMRLVWNGIVAVWEGGIKPLLARIWQWGKDMIAKLVAGIQAMIGAVANAIAGVVKTISEALTGLIDDAYNWAKQMMRKYALGIVEGIPIVGQAVKWWRQEVEKRNAEEPYVSQIRQGTNTAQGPAGTVQMPSTEGQSLTSVVPININLNVDGQTLARVLLPNLQDEMMRTGSVSP